MSHRPWEDTPSPRSTSSPPPPPPPPPAVLAGIPPPPTIYDYRPPPTLPPLSSSSQNPNGKRRRSSTTAPPPIPTPPSPPRPRNTNISRSFSSLGYNNHPRRFQYPTASSLAPLVAQIYNTVLNPAPGTAKTALPDLPTLDDIGVCLESVLRALPYTKSAVATTSPGSPPPPPIPLARDVSQLADALSRSQKRAEILEKKMVTLEAENEQNLVERERLQGSIEMLEEAVEELRTERDDARRELRVSGNQWGRIVGNAAKLERGLWLEVKRGREREDGNAEDAAAPACKQCACLRKRVDALEGVLEDVKLGGAEMGRLVQRLGALGQQVEGQVARGLGSDGACGGKPCSSTSRDSSGGREVRERLSAGVGSGVGSCTVDLGGGRGDGLEMGVISPSNPNDSVCGASNLR